MREWTTGSELAASLLAQNDDEWARDAETLQVVMRQRPDDALFSSISAGFAAEKNNRRRRIEFWDGFPVKWFGQVMLRRLADRSPGRTPS